MSRSDIIAEVKNPRRSIFVSANAGSGKTFILVTRVLGLLLAGEEPTKILCISFTEAACREVQKRILEKLKQWHNEDFAGDVLLQNASKDEVMRAKNLYKEVVLDRKMPKIMTFHAFCIQIISLFSVESGYPYKPTILNPIIQKSIFNKILKVLINQKDAKMVVDKTLDFISLSVLKNSLIPKLLKVRESAFFKNPTSKEAVNNYLRLTEADTEMGWHEDFMLNFPFYTLKNLLDKLETTTLSPTQLAGVEKLKLFYQNKDIKILEKALFTTDGKPRARPPFSSKLTNEVEEWNLILEHFCTKSEILYKIKTASATKSIIDLALKIFEVYKTEKKALEALDFDDFITVVHQVFKGDEKDFILFKLDGGLKHILVDEAQDTNFVQWDILNSILEEFFSGEGARDGAKSLFVVGDEKQSIFGFQGSVPDALNFVFTKYKDNLTQLSLDVSRRTTKPILDFVDAIFKQEEYKNAVSKKDYQPHKSYKPDGFGRIEILELPEFIKEKKQINEELFLMPWEEDEDESLKTLLSGVITQKIVSILEDGRVVELQNRRVKPCDFMLLIKNRDEVLFSHLKKDLKRHNISITFCDKKEIGESFVISDFISLLKYLLNPQNSMALSVVLTSPMFGFDDAKLEQVFALKNEELLLPVLALKPLLLCDVEGFFIECFTRFKHKYSEEEIREFSQIFVIIQNYKSTTFNSNFEGFIAFFEGVSRQKADFKLDLEEAENAVKISTVHGAKGLESTIVFILNASEVFSREASKDDLLWSDKQNLFLFSKKDFRCKEWQDFKTQKNQLDYEEYIRLFYVALTRAREEIYIFPSKKEKDTEYKSWYEIAKNSLPALKLCQNKMNFILNEDLPKSEEISRICVNNILPDFVKTKNYKATDTKEKSASLQVGSIIHEMLELKTDVLNLEYFQKNYNLVSQEVILNLWQKNLKIKEKFKFLFAKEVLTEVEIIQEIENGIFRGKIDKLIIEDFVSIYDFKYQKNEELLIKEIPFQFASYKNAIAKIYPNKAIKCFIVWIKEEELEEIYI
jgi:ATP-dependent helicase/nuclease subunit A